jgi:hypothetical protein
VTIRAGERVQPVLEVEVKGGTPFLTTRGDSPLRLEGVTVVARYVEPGSAPAAVIEAGSNVTLERCAFRLEGPKPGHGGARALALEGGTLSASGCWFENFDHALDLSLFGGSTCTVRECMFVPGCVGDAIEPEKGQDQAKARAGAVTPGGWAVRLRGMPGGFARSGRHLVLERCTAQGRGFLGFEGFSLRCLVHVDVRDCAVMADALAAWEPAGPPGQGAPALPGRDALSWSGKHNQYDIRGGSWLRLVPPGGGPPAPWPVGPPELDAWTHAVVTESDPVLPPVRFATDPSALSERPEPADFAVTDLGAANAKPVGADPARVGPSAKQEMANP